MIQFALIFSKETEKHRNVERERGGSWREKVEPNAQWEMKKRWRRRSCVPGGFVVTAAEKQKQR